MQLLQAHPARDALLARPDFLTVQGLAKLTRDPAGRQRDALAVSVVDGMLPQQPQWSGIRSSLQDLLSGHRLDAHKVCLLRSWL